MMDIKKEILEYITKRKEVRVKEIIEALEVSHMTVYRYLRELEREGLIERKAGKVRLVEGQEDECYMCKKHLSRIKVVFKTNIGEYSTCCPHCGFRFIDQLKNKGYTIESAFTHDFLYDTTIELRDAHLIKDSSIRYCCSPSILPFAFLEDADRIRTCFGGQIIKALL